MIWNKQKHVLAKRERGQERER